jgi:uncharacterized membrane protein YhaH (DUF805 family)
MPSGRRSATRSCTAAAPPGRPTGGSIVVAEIVIFGLAAAIRSGAVGAVLFVIFGIAVIYLALVGLSLTIRRLHDSNKTGWWVLISLVPFGGIVILVFTLLEPTPGPNRYQP